MSYKMYWNFILFCIFELFYAEIEAVYKYRNIPNKFTQEDDAQELYTETFLHRIQEYGLKRTSKNAFEVQELLNAMMQQDVASILRHIQTKIENSKHVNLIRKLNEIIKRNTAKDTIFKNIIYTIKHRNNAVNWKSNANNYGNQPNSWKESRKSRNTATDSKDLVKNIIKELRSRKAKIVVIQKNPNDDRSEIDSGDDEHLGIDAKDSNEDIRPIGDLIEYGGRFKSFEDALKHNLLKEYLKESLDSFSSDSTSDEKRYKKRYSVTNRHKHRHKRRRLNKRERFLRNKHQNYDSEDYSEGFDIETDREFKLENRTKRDKLKEKIKRHLKLRHRKLYKKLKKQHQERHSNIRNEHDQKRFSIVETRPELMYITPNYTEANRSATTKPNLLRKHINNRPLWTEDSYELMAGVF